MHRTQIYLDNDQERRLAERAQAERRTKSAVIRAALDAYLEHPLSEGERLAQFAEAADAIFGIAPYLAPDYVDRIRDADRRRVDDLECGGSYSMYSDTR